MSDSNLREELDGVLAAARQTVADRRLRGDYPPGLEREMERHFRELMHAPSALDLGTSHLEEALERLATIHPPTGKDVELSSRVVGGSTIHALVGKVISRQTAAVLSQLELVRGEIEAALRIVLDGLRSLESHEHQHLVEGVSGVLDRIAVLDSIVLTVAEHDERLRALESAANVAH